MRDCSASFWFYFAFHPPGAVVDYLNNFRYGVGARYPRSLAAAKLSPAWPFLLARDNTVS